MGVFLDILIVVIKAAFVMGALLNFAALNTWVERKGAALIQDRIGANRCSIFGFDLAGIFNTLLADPIKALTKEDFVPPGTSQFMHSLAVFLAIFPVLISFAVIPFGPPIILESRIITMQLAELNVGILYVFAMGSLAVYGCVLAGWGSSNKFSLLGGLRASAQMISYEITMGISIVGLLAMYQTLDLNKIVMSQDTLLKWGIFGNGNPFLIICNTIAFVVFFTSMMAETKRAPFDLPESESELVAGYLTEYSGMKFLLFWLGEFAEIVVASALFVVLFFGGWQLPGLDFIAGFLQSVVGSVTTGLGWTGGEASLAPFIKPVVAAHVFGAKVAFFCVLQIVIRWTLPRFRYDQLMNLCWKIMLPISLVNVIATVAIMLATRAV